MHSCNCSLPQRAGPDKLQDTYKRSTSEKRNFIMAVQERSIFYFLAVAALAVIAAGQCEDSACGPNARCPPSPPFFCKCNEGYYGRPPWKPCRLESDPECLDNNGCADNLECRDRLCESPCSRTCSPDIQCIVRNHTATCGRGIYPTEPPQN